MLDGKRLALAAAGLVIVIVGMQMIDVRAQVVDDAVSVTPARIDFGVTIPEVAYEASCDVDTDPTGASGECLTIYLSESFYQQTQYVDVEYSVYCEDKPLSDPHRGDANITPFIILKDSDPSDDNDTLENPNGPGQGCGKIDYTAGAPFPLEWARGELDKRFDTHDLWDMTFYAPLCSESHNALTDPLNPADQPGGGLIGFEFCHKGPGPDSDTYVDLASNVKFEITAFSLASPTPTPSGTALGFTATPIGFPQTGGGNPSSGGNGLWLIVSGGLVIAIALAGYALYTGRVLKNGEHRGTEPL